MIARDAGAETPFLRPQDLADDHTPLSAVLSHALRELGFDRTTAPDTCCVYPTAALLEPRTLRAADQQFRAGTADFVFGAIRCPVNMVRAFTTSTAGTRLLLPEFKDTRTQDLPSIFMDAGQFCFGRGAAWVAECPVLGGESQILELDPASAVDLDTPQDWTEAESRAALLPRFHRPQ